MSCRILLDNSNGVYHPGDTVQGLVEYTFQEAEKLRGIIIEVKGYAYASWQYVFNYVDEGQMVPEFRHYFCDREYMNIRYYFEGSSSGEITIPAGKVTYPFTVILPQDIPSSFESEYGHVQYSIKSILHRARNADKEDGICFQVFAPINLNSDLSLAQPKCAEIEKTFGWWCCSSGHMRVFMKVPATGFVPGQTIPIAVQCDNASTVKAESVIVSLIRRECYGYRSVFAQQKREFTYIVAYDLGTVDAHENRTWNTSIEIPAHITQSFVNCDIVQVSYDVHLCFNVPQPHFNPTKSLEITIGSVPFSPLNAPSDDAGRHQLSSGSEDISEAHHSDTPSIHTPLLRK